jgi:NAD(P)-dependent dehydrogenase (short-subunit alcohol dehydrogenase family)
VAQPSDLRKIKANTPVDFTGGTRRKVTGGGSGIGLALTEALVRRGNRVIICGRRRNRLRAAQARVPGIHSRVCDISNARSRQALVDWVLSEFREVNILVNNAGIQRQVNFLKGSRDLGEADEEVATELSGRRSRAEEGEHVISAAAVAAGVVEALERNQYEVALGAAVNLRAEREALFSAINQ